MPKNGSLYNMRVLPESKKKNPGLVIVVVYIYGWQLEYSPIARFVNHLILAPTNLFFPPCFLAIEGDQDHACGPWPPVPDYRIDRKEFVNSFFSGPPLQRRFRGALSIRDNLVV